MTDALHDSAGPVQVSPETPPETPSATPPAADLATAVQNVLAVSPEPLTLSKIRAKLPTPYREVEPAELEELLKRQAAAGTLHVFPPYRSTQERFWDRPMTTHVASLLRSALAEAPLAWSELRRRLPGYARSLAQAVLDSQVAQGLLHRHPRTGARGPEKLGVSPADARDYLRVELPVLFRRLSGLGFTPAQLRAAALELLHEEEWDILPPEEAAPPETAEPAAPTSPAASTIVAAASPEGIAAPTPPPPAAPAAPAAPAPGPEPHVFGPAPAQASGPAPEQPRD